MTYPDFLFILVPFVVFLVLLVLLVVIISGPAGTFTLLAFILCI